VNDGASVARHVDIEFVTNDGEVVITERRERPMPPGETEVVRLSIPRDQYRGPYDILVGWDDGRGRNREKSGVRVGARVDRRRSRWRARRREERRRSSRVHLSMVPRSAVVNDPRYPLTREPRARPRSRSSRLAMCTMGTRALSCRRSFCQGSRFRNSSRSALAPRAMPRCLGRSRACRRPRRCQARTDRPRGRSTRGR
jgi:hypothetical protein